MNGVKSLVLAARPKTLTAAFVPILVGTAYVHFLGWNIQWWISICALMASLFIQIGTNLVNDAIDFKRGADTETRIGPRRVTQSGMISYQNVLRLAALFFVLAIGFGIPLVIKGGWPILGIGVMALIFGYAYTAGPFPLAYQGLGDIFVIIFFGLVAVSGLVFLHLGNWSSDSLILGMQIGMHCTVLIAINNLRDMEGDQKVGKKTLPVRFGKAFGRWEVLILCGLPFFLNFYWWSLASSWVLLLPLISLPLAIAISFLVFKTEPSPAYNQFLAAGATLHLIFGSLLSMAFIL